MNTIRVNGNSYSGNNIVISNNKVFIDGKDVTNDSKEINISVNGNLETLTVDSCNQITVTENINCKVKCQNGNINCHGDIAGDVKTTNGNIKASSIWGNASTVNGNITK